MFSLPNGPELVFILALALIVFGPKKLPEIGKSIGKGLRELRKASREITDALDFRDDLNLNNILDDGDDEDILVSKSDTNDSEPNDSAESDDQVDLPKENDQDAANSMDPERTGIVDSSPDNSGVVRSEETSGDRKVTG